MAERLELEDEMLDAINGGTISFNYSKATQTGTLSSDQVAGTYTFTGANKANVMGYIYSHNIGYADADVINYMVGQGWLVQQ